ncbi:MAG: hypothetical protein ACOC2C_02910 [Cyclonatronaceae bacterium]
MAEKNSKSSFRVIYNVLLVLAVLMHMSFSGLAVGNLLVGIFTAPDGIITFATEVFEWTLDFIFQQQMIYMFATTIILWFVGLPLLVRYRVVQVPSTLRLAIIITLYLFLSLKLLGTIQ